MARFCVAVHSRVHKKLSLFLSQTRDLWLHICVDVCKVCWLHVKLPVVVALPRNWGLQCMPQAINYIYFSHNRRKRIMTQVHTVGDIFLIYIFPSTRDDVISLTQLLTEPIKKDE